MRTRLQMVVSGGEKRELDVDGERAQLEPCLQLYSWLPQMMGGEVAH